MTNKTSRGLWSASPTLPLIVFTFSLLLPGASLAQSQAPKVDQEDLLPSKQGSRLLRAAIAAHGGIVYEDIQDLAVSFSGRWGRIGRRFQPVLADSGFRTASEERFLFAENASFQWSSGPDGNKVVFQDDHQMRVYYNGHQSRDARHLEASAAALDLYEFLLVGPSWLTRRELDISAQEEKDLGNEPHQLLKIHIQPGFGSAERDTLVLWLHKQSHILQRVETTLSGFAPLKNRALEITLGGHQWHAGKLWPTRYLQRIDIVAKVLFHRWQLTGIEVNRGLTAEALSKIDRIHSGHPALRPANPISFSPNR